MKVIYQLSWVILSILITAISCSPSRIVSFHNDTMDFSRFTTFRIEHPYSNDAPINEKVKKVTEGIESIIAQEMESRDYGRSGKPDIVVKYRINLSPNSQTDVNNNNRPFMRGGGYLPYYDPYFIDASTYDYVEGIVLIEFMERASGKLAWQASKDVEFNPRRETSDAVIFETLNVLFQDYRYRAGSNQPVAY